MTLDVTQQNNDFKTKKRKYIHAETLLNAIEKKQHAEKKRLRKKKLKYEQKNKMEEDKDTQKMEHTQNAVESEACCNSFYRIDNSSSSEQIRGCLTQHLTEERTNDMNKKLDDIRKKFNLSTFIESTSDPKLKQQANVCIICDRLIIGLEEVLWLSKDEILLNSSRLSIENYELYYRIQLPDILKKQYEVTFKDENDNLDDELVGILLSPRARRTRDKQFSCCKSCHYSITSGCKSEIFDPPKYAIANGFAIGSIPRVLKYMKEDGEPVEFDEYNLERDIIENEILCNTISTIRPWGFVQAWTGGKSTSLKGHLSLFSVDQSHVGGVFNKYKNSGNSEKQPSKNVFVVLCGRFTPNQKNIIRKQAKLNTDVFVNLLNWFIKTSGHQAYEDVTPPDQCPDMIAILEDEENDNNTDDTVDDTVECRIEGKTYYFSSESHKPNERSSVYDATPEFVDAMLNNEKPTMLLYGGSYKKSHEVNLEDVFPVQFPFGLGGPDLGVPRKVPVSEEACIRHYLKLSLKQFMRPDFILVCYHIICRSTSFKTGVIKCKSSYQGSVLAEKISQLTIKDIQRAASYLAFRQSANEPLIANNCGTNFLKSVTTSCKVLGHTTEAAKDARRKMYALTERFGPHSIFLTITPDDQCTFVVRMYVASGTVIELPTPNCSDNECFLDFQLRAKIRTTYPGASSLYYQAAIQVVYKLIGWNPDRNRPEGVGMFGPPKAMSRTDEEQNRGTLHGHILIWVENFAEVCNLLYSSNEEVRQSAREALKSFVDNHFSSDYNYDNELEVVHKECGRRGTISELFEEAPAQDIRDCRDKDLCQDLNGKILCCKFCSNVPQKKMNEGRISTVELHNMVMQAYSRRNEHSDYDVNVRENNASEEENDVIMRENDIHHVNEDVSATVSFPPNRYRRDIMTYRSPLDTLHPDCEDFYFNFHVRHHIVTYHTNEHDHSHRRACFKYDCSCRMRLPRLSKCNSLFTIDEDPEKCTTWWFINGEKQNVYPYSVETRRPLGSQYLNTHNKTLTSIFGCNNNVQIGSPRCLFYVVHYSSKSTQKEDRGVDFERIGYQVIRRIEKELQKLKEADALNSEEKNDTKEMNYIEEQLHQPMSSDADLRSLLDLKQHAGAKVCSNTFINYCHCGFFLTIDITSLASYLQLM